MYLLKSLFSGPADTAEASGIGVSFCKLINSAKFQYSALHITTVGMTVCIFDSVSNPILVVEGVRLFKMYKSIQRQKFHCCPGLFTRTSVVGWAVSIHSCGNLAREKRLKTWMTWQWCFSAWVLRIRKKICIDPFCFIHPCNTLTSVPQQGFTSFSPAVPPDFVAGFGLWHSIEECCCTTPPESGSVGMGAQCETSSGLTSDTNDLKSSQMIQATTLLVEDEANDQTRVPKEALWDGVSGAILEFCTFPAKCVNCECRISCSNSAAQSLSHHYEAFLKVHLDTFVAFISQGERGTSSFADSPCTWDLLRSVPSLSSSSTKSLSTKPSSWTLRMMESLQLSDVPPDTRVLPLTFPKRTAFSFGTM